MTDGQIGNVDLVKQLNSAAVYRLIDQHESISRIQIAELSSLAPASVTKITRQLLKRGLIKEIAQQASTGGRRAISLTTECHTFHSLAVRLGREKIHLSLFDLAANLLAEYEQEFAADNAEQLVTRLIACLHHFLAENREKTQELIAISIVLPGLIQPESGIISYLPHVKVDALPLADLIRDEFNLPCFVGNDTRARALAEHYFGASKNYQDSLLVSVRNGTGAGFIVNGQVFLGSKGNMGEIGHIQIDPLGKKCQCGNFGCLETIASNPAIIAHTKQLLAQGHASSLAEIEHFTISDICQAALAGDKLARLVLVNVGEHLGRAIAISINLFNPEQVVISGRIIEAAEIILPAISRCVNHQSLHAFHQDLPIVAAELGTIPTLSAFALIKRAMLNGVLLQKLLENE